MKKAKSQKLVVGMLCAVVFFVIFYQFSWKARGDTLSQAAVVRVATEARQGDLAVATKAKTQEPVNRAALAAVQAVLPANADAQGVIRKLTQLAVTSSVSWESVTLAPPAATATPGLQAVSLTVAISGSMANVEAYLANIRKADVGRIITVDAVGTTFKPDAAQPDLVSATLGLKAFVYAVDPSVLATPTTVAPAVGTNTVTQTPVGTVPTAVTDPTNVGPTTTAAFTG
jgi:Tfp pilus assembly protein PilO